MRRAKSPGPKTSPTCLATPAPCWAKKDDHWLIVSSAAPPVAMSARASRNAPERPSSRSGVRCAPGTVSGMGARVRTIPLATGTHAQAMGSAGHHCSPTAASAPVVTRTTPSCPQQ